MTESQPIRAKTRQVQANSTPNPPLSTPPNPLRRALNVVLSSELPRSPMERRPL